MNHLQASVFTQPGGLFGFGAYQSRTPVQPQVLTKEARPADNSGMPTGVAEVDLDVEDDFLLQDPPLVDTPSQQPTADSGRVCPAPVAPVQDTSTTGGDETTAPVEAPAPTPFTEDVSAMECSAAPISVETPAIVPATVATPRPAEAPEPVLLPLPADTAHSTQETPTTDAPAPFGTTQAGAATPRPARPSDPELAHSPPGGKHLLCNLRNVDDEADVARDSLRAQGLKRRWLRERVVVLPRPSREKTSRGPSAAAFTPFVFRPVQIAPAQSTSAPDATGAPVGVAPVAPMEIAARVQDASPVQDASSVQGAVPVQNAAPAGGVAPVENAGSEGAQAEGSAAAPVNDTEMVEDQKKGPPPEEELPDYSSGEEPPSQEEPVVPEQGKGKARLSGKGGIVSKKAGGAGSTKTKSAMKSGGVQRHIAGGKHVRKPKALVTKALVPKSGVVRRPKRRLTAADLNEMDGHDGDSEDEPEVTKPRAKKLGKNKKLSQEEVEALLAGLTLKEKPASAQDLTGGVTS